MQKATGNYGFLVAMMRTSFLLATLLSLACPDQAKAETPIPPRPPFASDGLSFSTGGYGNNGIRGYGYHRDYGYNYSYGYHGRAYAPEGYNAYGRAYGLHGDNRHGYHAGGYNYGYGTRTHDGYITTTPPNSK